MSPLGLHTPLLQSIHQACTQLHPVGKALWPICRQILEVDAMQDGGTSCQYEPEALVSAIKYIVEEHAASQDGSPVASNGACNENGLHADVHVAPPLGFHGL